MAASLSKQAHGPSSALESPEMHRAAGLTLAPAPSCVAPTPAQALAAEKAAGRCRPRQGGQWALHLHSTCQMAILPSSLPDPLSTYLSSAEHRVLTVSACATSSFSTVFVCTSIT